jgi:hypothetical protein
MFERIGIATFVALLAISDAGAGDLNKTPLVVPTKNNSSDTNSHGFQRRDLPTDRSVETTVPSPRRQN